MADPQAHSPSADVSQMRQQGFDGGARPEFWLAHVRAGIVLTEIGCAIALVYIATEPGLDRTPALVAVVVGLMAGTGSILLMPLRAILAHRRAAWFFYAWSTSATAVVTLGAALTGGSRSPIVAFYFLIMVYAATAYPPYAQHRLAVGMVGAYVLMGISDPIELGASVVVAGALALTAWMSSIAARTQWRQLQEQMDLARVDGLTGALNQRAFREVLDAEVERAHRFGHPLSLVIVDLDDFKAVNDREGHLAGDGVLAATGAVLRRSVRAIDVVGRIGGDEFAVLLIETDLPGALDTAARVRRWTQESAPSTTLSIDVAELAVGATADALLEDADRALYAAKRAGRDTVRSGSAALGRGAD